MHHCYRCDAGTNRRCTRCSKPVCREHGYAWYMHEAAVKAGDALCGPCIRWFAKRELEDARELLRKDGVELQF